MMNRRVLIFMAAMMLACHATNSLAQIGRNTAKDILIQAAKSRGAEVIHTGEFSFRAVVTLPNPSAAKVRKAVERQKAALVDCIDRLASQPDVRQRYEDALADNESVVTEQLIANARREIKGMFRLHGPDFGGDRMAEVRVRRGNATDWEPLISLLTRRLDGRTRQTITVVNQDRMAMVNGGAASVGIAEPHILGRLHGPLLTLLGYDAVPRDINSPEFGIECAFVEDYPSDNPNDVCIRFDSVGGPKKFSGRIVLDPSRGYVCPLIEFSGVEGGISARIECSEFFMNKESDLWFPGRCRSESVLPDNSGRVVTEYWFEPEGVHLNNNLSQKMFSVVLPTGTNVSYQLAGRAEECKTTCDVTVAIDDLNTLLDHKCLAAVSVSVSERQLAAGGSAMEKWFIVANVCVILILIAWVLIRRRKLSAPLSMLFVLIVGGSCTTGCGLDSIDVAEVPLTVRPMALDFGEIAATGQKVKGELTITNTGPSSTHIDITAACGCIVADDMSFTLAERECKKVPFTISTYGRSGSFSSLIRIQSSNGDSVSVPLSAIFITQIFSTPSRVFLLPDDEHGLVGTFSLDAPESVWPKLSIVTDDADLKIEKTESKFDCRRYRVTIDDAQERKSYGPLRVRMVGQEESVLTIPVFSGKLPETEL